MITAQKMPLEKLTSPLSVEAALHLLEALYHGRVDEAPTELVANAEFALFCAVLAHRIRDDHLGGFSIVADNLQKMLADDDKRAQQREILTKISFLLRLMQFISRDVKHRRLSLLPVHLSLGRLSQKLRCIIDQGRLSRALVSTVANFLSLLRELEYSPQFLEEVSFWCHHPKCRRDLLFVTRILTVVQSATRTYDELLSAHNIAASAVRNICSSKNDFFSYISTAELEGKFSQACSTVSRALFSLGMEPELNSLQIEIRRNWSEPDHKLAVAKALMEVPTRLSILNAYNIIRDLQSTPGYRPKQLTTLAVQAKMKCAEWAGLTEYFNETNEFDLTLSSQYTFYKHTAQFDVSSRILDRMLEQAVFGLLSSPSEKHLAQFLFCQDQKKELPFLSQIARQLQSHYREERNKGILVILHKTSSELDHFPLLSLAELQQAGYDVKFLNSGVFAPNFSSDEIADIAGQIGEGFQCARWDVNPDPQSEVHLTHDWDIDFDSGRLVCKEVNFFQGIHEALRCEFRRYSIDYAEDVVRIKAAKRVAEMDLIISCIDRLALLGKARKIPIRFLCATHQLGPGFAARLYIQKLATDYDVAFLATQTGYDNYFDKSAQVGETIAIEDLTRHPNQSGPSVGVKREFEKWYDCHWISSPRPKSFLSFVHGGCSERRTSDLQRSLRGFKRNGKTIVAVFGKVLFDQGLPQDSGPGHKDMRDWFEHCCQIAAANRNIVLLVKPHPQEGRHDIASYPTEMLRDWLPENLPENVIFLSHETIGIQTLSRFIHVGVVWYGTVCLELGILGVPVVICSHYGEFDYPVGHYVPEDRSRFARLLNNAKQLRPQTQTSSRCAALLEYSSSATVCTPYRYTYRTLTNKKLREDGWILEDLQRYQQMGDPHVTFLMERIRKSFLSPARDDIALHPVPRMPSYTESL